MKELLLGGGAALLVAFLVIMRLRIIKSRNPNTDFLIRLMQKCLVDDRDSGN